MARGDPRVTIIPATRQGQQDITMIEWPQPRGIGEGIPLPSTMPGQTTANPKASGNVVGG